MRPVQPTRGIFGASGYIDFKEDINADKGVAQLKVFYSSNGISYQLTPFRVPQISITKALNGPYKEYLMDAMDECCTGAPVETKFVSPLNKRLIECENCIFPSDNFPSGLRPGYYKLLIFLQDATLLDVMFTILLKLEFDI